MRLQVDSILKAQSQMIEKKIREADDGNQQLW